MAPLTLHDAEQIREVIVEPIIERLDARNAELVRTLATLESRVVTLETEVKEIQGLKAKVVLVATGAGIVAGACWDWVKNKIFGT